MGGDAALLCLGLLVAGGVGVTCSAFWSSSSNSGNSFGVAPDFVAPTLARSTVGEITGGTAQHIHPGSSYHLYGELADSGNPASGIASVTADLSGLTSGQTAAPLSAGAFSFAGANYNYRTGALTANATLTACSYTPMITAADAAGNSRTVNGEKVMVDRDLLNGYHIRLDGAGSSDQAGFSVAGGGDGRPDALIGARNADNNGRTDSGSAYIFASPTCS